MKLSSTIAVIKKEGSKIPRYCRQCGTSLTEEARFCRRCGTATAGLEPSGPGNKPEALTPPAQTRRMAGISLPSPDPTMVPRDTEPMTKMIETTSVSPVRATRRLKARRALFLAGTGIILVGAVALSFYLGMRHSPDGQPTLDRTTALTQTPMTGGRHASTAGETPSNPRLPARVRRHDEVSTNRPQGLDPVKRLRLAERHLKVGRDDLNAGRYQRALQEFRLVRRLDPANRDVFYLMGLAFEQTGRLDMALRAYQQCTSGSYAKVAAIHAKELRKKVSSPK